MLVEARAWAALPGGWALEAASALGQVLAWAEVCASAWVVEPHAVLVWDAPQAAWVLVEALPVVEASAQASRVDVR